MKTLDSKNELIELIQKVIRADNNTIYPIFQSELIDTNPPKMTNGEIQSILSFNTDLNNIKTEILVWIYSTIQKYNKNLPSLDHFFENEEIKQAEIFQITRLDMSFPLKFKIHRQLSHKEEYLISLSAQEINIMQNNGVIQLNAEMSRESKITNYHGYLVYNIYFSDTRSREIGINMSQNEYYSNGIRLHLVKNGNEQYQIKKDELIINAGDLVLIDGNHRVKGIEYGLLANQDMYLYLPVFLTIGNLNMGQEIIYQEEKREPLAKEHVETYKPSGAANIVKSLVSSNDLDAVYKFCDTPQAIDAGAGFILESILIQYIEKYYNTNNISKKQEQVITKWLVEFFNSLADILIQDFKNYLTIRKSKWSVSYFTFAGYIQLSKCLQGKDNWEELLIQIISSVDFNNQNRPWIATTKNPDKHVDKKFKELIDSVH
jgi:hypothetical protein